MQTRLREEFDADRENFVSVTDYATKKNRFEISCRTCNRTLFADENALSEYNHALKEGFDSPFLCEDCQLEESELIDER